MSDVPEDAQIAKAVYLRNMSAMKQILTLEEFRLGGRNSPAYRTFKKHVMDYFYNGMTEMFESWEFLGMVRKCDCGTSIRRGYKDCSLCNGAGFCNTDSLNENLTSNHDDVDEYDD